MLAVVYLKDKAKNKGFIGVLIINLLKITLSVAGVISHLFPSG